MGGLSFGKSMRWNGTGAAFSRPVRWLVGMHGETGLPFSFAGLQAGAPAAHDLSLCSSCGCPGLFCNLRSSHQPPKLGCVHDCSATLADAHSVVPLIGATSLDSRVLEAWMARVSMVFLINVDLSSD